MAIDIIKGCGVLFETDCGIVVCGKIRKDNNEFFCHGCLKEAKEERYKSKIIYEK